MGSSVVFGIGVNVEGKKLVDSNLDLFLLGGPNGPELPITFYGRKISFMCGEYVRFIGGGELVSGYIPIFKTVDTGVECCRHCNRLNSAKEPFARIQIQAYKDCVDAKKSSGFLSSLFDNESKSIPQSYIKIFCHLDFSCSPRYCRIEVNERDNDFWVYESPFIEDKEGIQDTVSVYLEKAMYELHAYTKRRFYSTSE